MTMTMTMQRLALCIVAVIAVTLAGCAGPTPTETTQNADEWAAIVDAIHSGHLAAGDDAETATWEARARAAHRLAVELHRAAGGDPDDLADLPPYAHPDHQPQTQPRTND